MFRPETAKPLLELAETLPRKPSSLTPGERELVASYVSNLNSCKYCTRSHSAFAAEYLHGDARTVAGTDIERARASGATEIEIHDVVLIAAAFCMFNRYVDGLGTWAPEDPGIYRQSAKRIVTEGYLAVPTKP